MFDLNGRLDFWYWTSPQKDSLTIVFPALQPYRLKPLGRRKLEYISEVRYSGKHGVAGGQFTIGLKNDSRLAKIYLMRPDEHGGHRLVVDIAARLPADPPAEGTGWAWGGGRQLDKLGAELLAKLYGTGAPAAIVKLDDSVSGVSTRVENQAEKPVPQSRTQPVKSPIPSAPEAGPAQTAQATDQHRTKPERAGQNVESVSAAPPFDPRWPPPMDAKARQQRAAELSLALSGLVRGHPRLKATAAEVEASRQSMLAARKANYPTVDITAFYGYERQNKGEGTADTNMPTREFDLKVTQPLTDFGATEASETQAELALEQIEAVYDGTVQGVLLEGISAYYQFSATRQALLYARQSEQNIKRQSRLEDARVKRGGGLATDLLQAKAQLAGATARRIRAEGAFEAASYRYLAVFGTLPPPTLHDGAILPVAEGKLPSTLEAGVDLALKSNPQLEASRLAAEIARNETKRQAASGYYPELNLIAESKWKRDVAGTIGFKGEQIVRMELTFPFNLGGTAIDSVNASKHAYLASAQRQDEARTLVRERVQSAWRQIETARLTASQLRNQAELAAAFLDLARKERKLGNRSLTEVLAGETALADARADAVTAENNLAIAAYTLLSAIGTLTSESVL